jgi:hypothetical protein
MNTHIATPGGAESGALFSNSALIDPNLQTVIDAWPDLPEAIRASIRGLVEAFEGALGKE